MELFPKRVIDYELTRRSKLSVAAGIELVREFDERCCAETALPHAHGIAYGILGRVLAPAKDFEVRILPDGRIETAVERIAAVTGKVDMASNGY